MGCAPVFNSCSGPSVLDGADIIVPLTDLQSDHFTDNAAVLYVGRNTPDGPVGEIHEITLPNLYDYVQSNLGASSLYTSSSQLHPQSIEDNMSFAASSLVLYHAIEAPQYFSAGPVTVEYAQGLFEDYDMVANAESYARFFNDSDNMMRAYSELREAVVDNPALEAVLDNGAIYIDSMDQNEWQEEWGNLSFWANQLVDDAALLEIAGDHREILKDKAMELDSETLLYSDKVSALEAMGYNSYGTDVSDQPVVPEAATDKALPVLGD